MVPIPTSILTGSRNSSSWRRQVRQLSRDSPVDQRTEASLLVQGIHRCVDFAVEGFGVSKCLMGEMMGFEIAPDHLDIIEFGRIFRQPLDSEPVGAGRKRFSRCLADVDRAVIEYNDDGFDA
jgi:hypothetical protein